MAHTLIKKDVTTQVEAKASGSKACFFEKSSKKLLIVSASAFLGQAQPGLAKVFCCFFSKKQALLPFALASTSVITLFFKNHVLA